MTTIAPAKQEVRIPALFRQFGEVWYRMYPIIYVPVDHSPGDMGASMLNQIIGILSNDLCNKFLIVTAESMQALRDKIKDFISDLLGRTLKMGVAFICSTHEGIIV